MRIEMRAAMNCLLIFFSGFMIWQFLVILAAGKWQYRFDFISLFLFSLVAAVFCALGARCAFGNLESKPFSFREGIVGIAVSVLSLAVLVVEILPAWINDGIIYGHEPNILVLLTELVLFSGICIFGIGNLIYDLSKRNF